MGAKAYFYAFAVICVCSAPAFAPPNARKTRADLSPLARAIDDALFADPHTLPYNIANPFQGGWYSTDEMRMTEAFAEVRALRGERVDAMIAQGRRALEEQRKRTIAAAFARIPTQPDQWDGVGVSWDVLRSGGKAEERPLPDTEVQQMALARTRAGDPEAFAGRGAPGLTDPIARAAYGRHVRRIELFEQQQTRSPEVTRGDFTRWKENQLRELAGRVQQNNLAALKIMAHEDPSQLHEVAKDGSVRNISFEEFRRRYPLAENLIIDTSRPQPAYLLATRLLLVDPKAPLFSGKHRWEFHNTHYASAVSSHPFNGRLNEENNADSHARAILEHRNAGLQDAFYELARFSYADYLRDGGRQFWKRWKMNADSEMDWKDRIKENPDIDASHVRLRSSDFAEALWSKIAADKQYYDKLAQTWSETPTALSRIVPSLRLPKEADISRLKTHSDPAQSGTPVPTLLGRRGISRGLLLAPIAVSAVLFGMEKPSPPAALPGITLPSGASDTLARNKPPLSTETFFHLKPGTTTSSQMPTRFALANLGDAKTKVAVPTQATVAAGYEMNGSLEAEGATAVPTGDGSTLSALRLYRAGTKELLVPGVDYEVRKTALGEYAIFPRPDLGKYRVEGEFQGKGKAFRDAPLPAALRDLDHEEMSSFAKELEAQGFTLLPRLLREMVSVSQSTGKPVSIRDFETAIRSAAKYSYQPERQQWFTLFRSEMNRASRFLNDAGISCYQCDGAQELTVLASKRMLRKHADLEVKPRTVLSAAPGALELKANDMHADVVIARTDGSGKAVLDTTPGTHDPRDLVPANPLRPSPWDSIPWEQLVLKLVDEWSRGEPRRTHVPGRTNIVTTSGAPEDPSKPAELFLAPVELVAVESPAADRVEAQWQLLKKRLVDLKAEVPTGSRLPPVVYRDVAKIAQRYSRGLISFEQAQKDLHPYLPRGFQWEDHSAEDDRMQQAFAAIGDRQLKFYEDLRAQYRTGRSRIVSDLVKDNPWVLDGAVETLTKQGFAELGSGKVRAPTWSQMQAATSSATGRASCQGTAGQFFSPRAQ